MAPRQPTNVTRNLRDFATSVGDSFTDLSTKLFEQQSTIQNILKEIKDDRIKQEKERAKQEEERVKQMKKHDERLEKGASCCFLSFRNTSRNKPRYRAGWTRATRSDGFLDYSVAGQPHTPEILYNTFLSVSTYFPRLSQYVFVLEYIPSDYAFKYQYPLKLSHPRSLSCPPHTMFLSSR